MSEAEKPAEEKPTLTGLFRDSPETKEGKYLVTRRDGTVPPWPWFVLGARDPAAEAALRAYASAAEVYGLAPEYVAAVERLADEFFDYRMKHGKGDPDKGRHRTDDPATIAKMREGRGA